MKKSSGTIAKKYLSSIRMMLRRFDPSRICFQRVHTRLKKTPTYEQEDTFE